MKFLKYYVLDCFDNCVDYFAYDDLHNEIMLTSFEERNHWTENCLICLDKRDQFIWKMC